MNKWLSLSAVLVLLVVLAGCPLFTSDKPVTPASKAEIDSTVIGDWEVYTKEGKLSEGGFISIVPFNEHEYLVELIEFSDSTGRGIKDWHRFKMHKSDVEDYDIFNMIMLKPSEDRKYAFYKYEELGPDSLMVYYLSNKDFKYQFKTSRKFKKQIKSDVDFEGKFVKWFIVSKKKQQQ